MFPSFQENLPEQRKLFQASLEEDRPQFIDYFLNAGFDPLALAEVELASANTFWKLILQLYKETFARMTTVCYLVF
jgi:hypothetical protein